MHKKVQEKGEKCKNLSNIDMFIWLFAFNQNLTKTNYNIYIKKYLSFNMCNPLPPSYFYYPYFGNPAHWNLPNLPSHSPQSQSPILPNPKLFLHFPVLPPPLTFEVETLNMKRFLINGYLRNFTHWDIYT